MSTAELAILVTIASIVSAALVAGIGAVWRLGSKVGGFESKLDAYKDSAKADKEEHEALAKRIEDTNEHVGLIDGRLQAVEAVCHERREQSMRFTVPPGSDDGTPTPVGGCR